MWGEASYQEKRLTLAERGRNEILEVSWKFGANPLNNF